MVWSSEANGKDKALLIDDAKASFDCRQTTILDF
jgi:flavin reductase (DIM6/NTAB) family NADH-FMN oxidoreductase RutF